MIKLYENEKTIISKISTGGNLACISDVEFAICAGYNLTLNKVYEIKEGFLLISYNENTCDLDYILVKNKSPQLGI